MIYAAAVLSLLIAAAVTRDLHKGHTWWAARLGRSRFRRADLPVGGAIMLVVFIVTGNAASLGMCIGCTVGAISVGATDLLPPDAQ